MNTPAQQKAWELQPKHPECHRCKQLENAKSTPQQARAAAELLFGNHPTESKALRVAGYTDASIDTAGPTQITRSRGVQQRLAVIADAKQGQAQRLETLANRLLTAVDKRVTELDNLHIKDLLSCAVGLYKQVLDIRDRVGYDPNQVSAEDHFVAYYRRLRKARLYLSLSRRYPARALALERRLTDEAVTLFPPRYRLCGMVSPRRWAEQRESDAVLDAEVVEED